MTWAQHTPPPVQSLVARHKMLHDMRMAYGEKDLQSNKCKPDLTRLFGGHKMVHAMAMAYSQQDLQCNKCKRSAHQMLSVYCICSGTFQPTMTP